MRSPPPGRPRARDRRLAADEETRLTSELISARALLAAATAAESAGDAVVRRAERRLRRARAEILEANAYLIASVARRYRRPGVDARDLMQDGSIGLLHAVEKFDPALGHRFEAYAVWWIRQHVFRAIAGYGRTIRVPVPMMEAHGRVTRVRRSFRGRYGREPDARELAERSGLPAGTIEAALALVDEPVSLQGRVGDGETELLELLPDPSSAAPDEQVAGARLKGRLESLVDALAPQERAVLALRFGLGEREEHGVKETADVLGLSRERVKRVEERAMSKLRAWSSRFGLADFLAA